MKKAILNIIILYLKVIYANKFTFFGFLFVILGFYQQYIGTIIKLNPPIIFNIIMYLGIFLLVVTLFGYGTYQSYNRTKKHIDKYKTIEPSFMKIIGKAYCDEVGMKMAIKEAKVHVI